MSISFEIPSFTILSIIIYQLRIFEGLCLILWTKSLKKKGMRSQNVNSLFIMGIILTIFSGISLWLPNIHLYGFPTDAERLLFYIIAVLYQIAYPILFFILGVFFLQFFRKNFNQNDRKVMVGPILFIASYAFLILLNIGFEYVYVFESYSLYILLYIPYMIISIIISINIIVGIAFLLLYFLHINKEFLLLFGTIILSLKIVNLIFYINYLSLFISD